MPAGTPDPQLLSVLQTVAAVGSVAYVDPGLVEQAKLAKLILEAPAGWKLTPGGERVMAEQEALCRLL